MDDPGVDLTAEHGAVLVVCPSHVGIFTCTTDGGLEGKPVRVHMEVDGRRYQVGAAADGPAAAAILAAVRVKLWPPPPLP
jgi:hypothetical protein